MKLSGFTIFVAHIDNAITFYEKLFGRAPDHKEENSCTFMFSKTKYFIHKNMAREEGMPPNEDHVEFEVENIDEAVNRLKQEGFSLEIEARQYYWGTSAYLRDLEGRLIELVQK